MRDLMGHQWGDNNFEDRLPALVYICPLRLDAEGQKLHAHAGYAELMLVREGIGWADVNGQQEQLTAGDFVLYSAGELHSYRSSKEQPLIGVSCGFTHFHLRGMEENRFIGQQDHPVVHAGVGSRPLDGILSALERASADFDTQSEEICTYLSAAAVTAALRIHRAVSERAEQVHYELSVRTRLYLDRHYLEPLTLDQIAQAMGVSKFHLDRVFASRTGQTPVQYIIQRRMARARMLLASSDMTVQRVAAQCGYSNYNYFTVLFRKIVGMTPGEYRRNVQGH